MRHSLFIKIFLWFWVVVCVCLTVAFFSYEWLQEDYHRPMRLNEQHLLQRIAKTHQPIDLKKRGFWRRLHTGWNLVTFPEKERGRIPDSIADFYEHALELKKPLWGKHNNFIMMGPLLYRGQVYIALRPFHWRQSIDDGERWFIPFMVVLIVTLLCAWLAWHITKPIRRLQSATKQLSQGNFDIPELRSGLRRRDELGRLSVEFVEMADSLQRLLQSHRQLLHDVSHELRSPLTRLQIALGIARKKDADSSLQTEHDRIERAASQVEGLIAQILDLAKLQHQDEVERRPEELVKLLELWVQDAELELNNKSLTVGWHVPNEKVIVDMDSVWMQRAFDNILRNAIRFSPEGGLLTVDISKEGKKYLIRLCDEGPGVPGDKLEEIFNPFTQVDVSRDHHTSGGYGIGLAMVQRIIRLHKGEVRAHNPVSGGFCIEWLLPVSSSDA